MALTSLPHGPVFSPRLVAIHLPLWFPSQSSQTPTSPIKQAAFLEPNKLSSIKLHSPSIPTFLPSLTLQILPKATAEQSPVSTWFSLRQFQGPQHSSIRAAQQPFYTSGPSRSCCLTLKSASHIHCVSQSRHRRSHPRFLPAAARKEGSLRVFLRADPATCAPDSSPYWSSRALCHRLFQ